MQKHFEILELRRRRCLFSFSEHQLKFSCAFVGPGQCSALRFKARSPVLSEHLDLTPGSWIPGESYGEQARVVEPHEHQALPDVEGRTAALAHVE